MIFKAKRYKWRAKNGNEHEAIGIIQTNLKQTLCSFDSPEQAEDVAHELLRVAAQWRLSSGRASEHTFGDTNRHVVEVPDTFAIARWRRDASVAEIARCILGTLKYEPHTADVTALRHALESLIETESKERDHERAGP